MDKLTMAHQYFLQAHKFVIENSIQHDYKDLVKESWDYVGDMQAEADKRLNADVEATDASKWQPDWGQSPEWASWWAMDLDNTQAHWYEVEPVADSIAWRRRTRTCKQAPSFGYQGNWKDSIRKRPEGK